jgi:mRNA interferase HicA
MKRNELLKHLRGQGCELLREGGKHSWWHNPGSNKKSSVPRHKEINDLLANKICKDLGVEQIKSKTPD